MSDSKEYHDAGDIGSRKRRRRSGAPSGHKATRVRESHPQAPTVTNIARTPVIEKDSLGSFVRALTPNEGLRVAQSAEEEYSLDAGAHSDTELYPSRLARLTARKLRTSRRAPRNAEPYSADSLVSTLDNSNSHMDSSVLEGLAAIRTTPYANSFLSRLYGVKATPDVLDLDWTTESPWMQLMSDIREFYTIKYPDRDHPCESVAPISYTTLQRCHLPQVHGLLCSTFWPNIDVTDCLDFYPERCTVVACYKRVVVGVVLLSSPAHTYITYLAVKAGWENCQIATKMLYHLIKLSPHRDMTLHVSPSNPAMILYNQFGFKTEEFILGFYEDYLDPRSALSKNAFRLRLRH